MEGVAHRTVYVWRQTSGEVDIGVGRTTPDAPVEPPLPTRPQCVHPSPMTAPSGRSLT